MRYYKNIADGGKIERRLRKRELLAFGFVLVIIIIIISLSWASFNRMKEFESKIERTHVVLRNFDLLYSAIRDERTFEKSYTISNDTSLLTSFNASVDSVDGIMKRLQTLTADNPSQVQLLSKIKADAGERLKMVQADLRLSKSGESISDVDFFYSTKKTMDEIRRLIYEGESSEEALMRERNKKQETFTSQTRVAITIFSLMIISVLIVSMIAITNEFNKRIALEEYLKSILDASLSGIQSFQSVRDGKGKITDFRFIHANLTSYQITKSRPESFIGKTFLQVYPDNFKHELFERFTNVVETGKSINFEFRYYYKNEEGWAKVAAVKLGDGITVTFEDISGEKRTETEAQNYMKALRRSNRELEQFAYIASHDLQEPLRKIMAFVDRLKGKVENSLSDESLDYFNRIVHSAQRMKALITDLLLYSRTGSIESEMKMINLQSLIHELVTDDFELLIKQKDASVNIGRLPVFQGSPVQMRQLFVNLISNSLKFINPEVPPVIDIYCEYLDGLKGIPIQEEELNNASFTRIYFKDNGIGFDEEDEKRIFEIFQRIHGKNLYEGTGIGLAICKKIVNIHHGTIIAKGNKEGGATFVITLPLRQHVPAQNYKVATTA